MYQLYLPLQVLSSLISNSKHLPTLEANAYQSKCQSLAIYLATPIIENVHDFSLKSSLSLFH